MQTRCVGCGCFTLYVTAIWSIATSRYAAAWCSTDVLWSKTTGWEHLKSRMLPTFSMPFHLIARRFWAACHSMLCRVKTLIKYFHWKTCWQFLLFFIPRWYFVISLCRPAVIQLLPINFSLHLARFQYCHHRSACFPSDSDSIHHSCAFFEWSA
jgi:hypothetical protein